MTYLKIMEKMTNPQICFYNFKDYYFNFPT